VGFSIKIGITPVPGNSFPGMRDHGQYGSSGQFVVERQEIAIQKVPIKDQEGNKKTIQIPKEREIETTTGTGRSWSLAMASRRKINQP